MTIKITKWGCNGSMDWWIDRWMDGWMDWWMDGWIDGWMDGWMDQWMDGWMDRWIDGSIKWSMNRWIDGLSTATPPPSSLNPLATTDFTDINTFLPWKDIVNAACLCFGSVLAVPLVSSSSSDRKSLSAREGGANLAVPIRTTTSCKCRLKNWFLLYTFLWTCRETVKSQASGIVYCTYAGALKGW